MDPFLANAPRPDGGDLFDHYVKVLNDEYERRTLLFEDCGSILAWNEQNPDKLMPIIMIYVEELGRLNKAVGKDRVAEFLTQYAENGRANGFHLTIAAQRPSGSSSEGILPMAVRDNMTHWIAFKCGKGTAAMVEYPQAVMLLGDGDGRVRIGSEWKAFQTFYMGKNVKTMIAAMDKMCREQHPGTAFVSPPEVDLDVEDEPDAEPERVPDIWDEPEIEDETTGVYQKWLERKGDVSDPEQAPARLIRELFPDAPEPAKLTGNTLAKWRSRLAASIASR
jgi:DNA segregation ATPase FtsK/SpoIIIE-like protein